MVDSSNNVYYYLNDHLGSAGVLMTSTGTVRDTYKYKPFGEVNGGAINNGQSYRYTGKPLDEELNLDWYYYGARYYSPEAGGRFLAVDPLAIKYPSVSPYVYTLNNPLKFIDPDGAENKFALSWAQTNMADKGIRFGQWYGRDGGWIFQEGTVPTQVLCYGSCFMSYMNSGEGIRNYLQNTGFSNSKGAFKGRILGKEWFKAGGDDRSFVTDPTKGEAGDIIFLGQDKSMQGHSALLVSSTVNEDGSITLNTVSTGSSGGDFGERTITLTKNDQGQWVDEFDREFNGFGQMHNTSQLEGQ